MKRKVLALLMAALLLLSLTACGEGGEETTITGMVTAVEGTVVSIVEISGDRGNMNFEKGERPEGFDGTMPNGENFPQRGENGEMPSLPEGMTMPTMPEGMTIPEGATMPSFEGWDGQTPPTDENGQWQRPSGEEGEKERPSGENGGQRPNMNNFMENMKTTQIDIGDAHISIQEDGVKASGSLSDIKAGVFVTITKNAKGKVTNVLVISSGFGGFGGGFGGGFRGGNFGGNTDSQQAS